ncbi:MAG: hypothetical protein KBD76_00670 [Bacteriovorax sp.]|nr:hypothetical protein [Bacteriovorax sp.]
MSSLLSVALCLIAVFSFVSCASTGRTVAQEQSVQRSPESPGNNKIVNRQYVGNQY